MNTTSNLRSIAEASKRQDGSFIPLGETLIAAAEEIETLRASIHLEKGRYAELISSLQECEEYFDNKADADHDETGFVPNNEMQLLSTVRAALEKSGAA